MIATDLMVIPGTIIKIGILFKVRQTLEDVLTRVCLARRSIRCRWSTPGFEQPLRLDFYPSLSIVLSQVQRKSISPLSVRLLTVVFSSSSSPSNDPFRSFSVFSSAL